MKYWEGDKFLMQKSNKPLSSAIEDEFYFILNEIYSLTKEISNIINKSDFNYEIDLVSIEDRYTKRNHKIKQLNNILSSQEGVSLINNNPKWNEFVTKVESIERGNISFFEKKTSDIKTKLTDINKKKNLLIYSK